MLLSFSVAQLVPNCSNLYSWKVTENKESSAYCWQQTWPGWPTSYNNVFIWSTSTKLHCVQGNFYPQKVAPQIHTSCEKIHPTAADQGTKASQNLVHRNCSGLLTLKIQGFIHKSHLEGVFFHPCFPVVPILTSQPGHAVGFGRGSVNPEGFGGKSLLVLGFLHQVSDLSHEPVQEARQHCSAPDHHQVLCQLLPGVYGALMHTGTQKNPK